MRKQTKRAAAIVMAAAMTTTLLAGCGGSGSSAAASESAESTTSEASSEASTGEAAASGSYTDYSAGFPERVTIQIPVYDRGFENWNVADNYYTQWVQQEFGEKYNVDVEYVAISRSNEVTDYMQMIAAGTAPDIIMHYDMPQAVSYYDEGAMQDIDYDELAFYAPTYWAKMQETIETYGTIDDHQAFIFAERDPYYYNWVTLIRKDWCDQVGMEVPTTWEELQEVLAAWQEAGLGTYNHELIIGSFTYFYPWIEEGTTDEELALYLDLNVAPFTWSATENYLRAFNEMYNAGTLDPNFYLTTDDAMEKGKFVSGECGTYSFYMSNGTDVFTSLLANDPDAEVAILNSTPSIVAEGYTPYYYEYPSYGMIMGINSQSTDEERAAVYMFLEWLSQPENLTYMQYGVEGETYTVGEDGINTLVADYTGEAALSQNQNKDYWCLVVESITYGDEEMDLTANKSLLAPAGYEDLIQQSYDMCKANEDAGLISPIFTSVVESSADYTADLKALWQEAYVACITAAPEDFDATYEEYCQEYLDAGYQDILDEKQELIDAGSVIYAE
ncbi:MAG TPA: extracellular solute-binding protein [Candidatus Gemmiger avicola]|uniref:Extracellular solute-binding protein n=1 Tax=Candidatus Gemmiger avicola TaxID=2838605 RepID=A0A9D2S3Q4_9FIRM|nr:extracellular solute-binding protein [Candidatus Gemmiger avicola]